MSEAAGPAWRRLLPGLLLAAAVAATAFALRQIPGVRTFSPLLLAIVVGMLVGNLWSIPAAARPGLAFSMRRPLRIGIALLGVQLTLTEVLDIGGTGIAILLSSTIVCFAATILLGRALQVDRKLTQLIAAGTSICGASAIIAANTVVRDRDEGVAYALGVVTLFGTIVMFGFPLLGVSLAMPDHPYGLWIGAAVHEVPQVVAAAFAHGQASGEIGTVAKLARVLLLAPMVLLLPLLAARNDGAAVTGRAPVPWFVFGFLLMVLVATFGLIPAAWKPAFALLTQMLLAFSLGAVGLETHFLSIAARGWRPLLLGALATVVIGGWSLIMVRWWM
jgi:uncharacterized integral membrane protein (TIGR00698 family)